MPIYEEEIEVEEITKEVNINVTVEKPVKNIVYIDVNVDKVIEKPTKRTIHKDVITEVEVEK